MPVRIPAATRTEVWCMGAAGVSGLAPFYLLAPGAEERLGRQTIKWAPRWERNISMFRTPAERSIQRVSPPIERAVQRMEHRLPLEKAAVRTAKTIERNFERIGLKQH